MFFKSKNQKRREESAKCMAGLAQAASSGAVYAGTLGMVRMVQCTPEQEAFRKNVDAEVERRLAFKKAEDEFNAAPAYRIVSSYDVNKNEDTYHLQGKSFSHGWGTPHVAYNTIYSSTDKAGVEARFKRLQPVKAGKKAA